jgi:ribA/ribD-fused uncharacterized protein
LPRRRNDSHYDGGSPYGTSETKGIISSFSGEHAFLSNFWEEPFDCGGRVVPTSEHAFQAQKTSDPVWRDDIVKARTPGIAKRLGRKAPLRPNWNEVRVSIMRKILAHKFAPGTELAAKLIATHPAELVEGNTWGDTFWGCVHPTPGSNLWVGANHLGILLMERRAELMRG